MPANAIKTPIEERYWNECKASVKKAHPDYEGDSFYEAVMGCVKIRKQNASKAVSEDFIPIGKPRRRIVGEAVNMKLHDSVASAPPEQKIYGENRWDVESAARTLEEAELLATDPTKSSLYNAALKFIRDKKNALDSIIGGAEISEE